MSRAIQGSSRPFRVDDSLGLITQKNLLPLWLLFITAKGCRQKATEWKNYKKPMPAEVLTVRPHKDKGNQTR